MWGKPISLENQAKKTSELLDPITHHPVVFERRRFGLLERAVVLALLLAIEWVPLSSVVHTNRGGNPTARFIVTLASIFLTFALLKARKDLPRLSASLELEPIRWGLLIGHLAALTVFVSVSVKPADYAVSLAFFTVWWVSGIAALLLPVVSLFPLNWCAAFVRSTGRVGIYSLIAGVAAWRLGELFRLLWEASLGRPITGLTFVAVKAILGLFVSELVSDPAHAILGSKQFHIFIGAACSGLEGMGLILVFGLLWLWVLRRELRFPQALALIPAGLLLMWFLNAVRIAALILIGHAGAPAIAIGGFHSQAGWIAFNGVALGFCLAATHLPWLRAGPVERESVPSENATAAYLLPFLSILAASLVSRAMSGNFEWSYPLRVLAAAGALWWFRGRYSGMDWSFTWAGPVTGVVVFGLWLGLDRLSPTHDNSLASGLASLGSPARVVWLAFRTLGAVVTVPIAEELAFRGFLLRRVISVDFESVSLRSFTLLSLLVSSVAFGLLHGDRWIAGACAGALYAGAALRKGKIGDAIAAHALTNALLAAWVITRGAWDLW